jgi:inhibitor of cysteine peptidase
VSDVNNPTEVAKYIIDGDYTDSSALYEPKAFLFDKAKELLVIPVSVTEYGVVDDGSNSSSDTPKRTEPAVPDDEVYSSTQASYWQGAYVFKLTASGGFEYKGRVTHITNTDPSTYYLYDYNLQVERALYIGNTLYTISNTQIKLNNLTTLAEIATVNLQ